MQQAAKLQYRKKQPAQSDFCSRTIRCDMCRHVARCHLDLAWCTVWKGALEDLTDHVRYAHSSPRARGVLFTLSRPKGLRVGPIVEKCAEFRNPFLKKIPTELFSEIEIKQGYPLFKISHTNLTP